MREDIVIRLRDGRALAYAEYGDPTGMPLIYFHGSPGSRLGGKLAHDAAERHGVRVISPDRPGHGLSDYQERRRLLDWPSDVIELTESIGLRRFAIAGMSAGGPYASACAFRIPDRLNSVFLLSSGGPLDAPGAMDGMMPLNMIGFRIARHAPLVLGVMMALLARRARRKPTKVAASAVSQMSRADRQVLSLPGVTETMERDLSEAFRQGGRGAARDVQIVAQPWGFRLADIRMRVYLWHGEDDRNAPIRMGRHMARAIPNCEARFFPDEGHMAWVNHSDELMASITAADQTRPPSSIQSPGRH